MPDRVAGYEWGPDATVRATRAAWSAIPGSRAVIVVEGVSDQIAVEATAHVRGVDLAERGVVVLPAGGAQGFGRCLRALREHPTLTVAGLCDAGEVAAVRRAIPTSLAGSGGAGRSPEPDLVASGFFVCHADLEDELIRASGRRVIDDVVDAEGDRAAFDTMRAQPAWRDRPFEAQVRRFIAAGAGRKLRYASALVRALDPLVVPAPLVRVLDRVGG